MYVCMCACVRMYVCMYVCMCVCMYVWGVGVYIHVCVCMHACMHASGAIKLCNVMCIVLFSAALLYNLLECDPSCLYSPNAIFIYVTWWNMSYKARLLYSVPTANITVTLQNKPEFVANHVSIWGPTISVNENVGFPVCHSSAKNDFLAFPFSIRLFTREHIVNTDRIYISNDLRHVWEQAEECY